ncbi:MAG: hypothetical protein GYA65_10475 [Actinobacteria bacterium]|jgi:hypothetical protein|nr:hypothetical protein [Acidimicrobiaceae bacterium]MBP6487240.1 hypothetical protein [Ilumatobacteraceae bacterium]NMD24594.1 hypothetical protein [Actinomycetota bacterium]MBK9969475.1 hypothetical protein [Acidimicrobiaceae bacterium]MBP7888418.1 hypothetical protein [Ilumatobacteraceae bacterium]
MSTPHTKPHTTPHRQSATDPVRARRQKIAKYTLLANRVGYLFYALAIATFVIGFAVSFNGAVSAIVIGSLIIGSVLLAPAIVLGYAVKAAERDDRERGL